jgi:lysophospholipase L1-like esterase
LSDRLLLAASLITVGQAAAPPPPILPIVPDHLSTLLASTVAQTLQSNQTPQIIPVLDVGLPEFSQSKPDLAPTQLLQNWQALPLPQSSVAPTSGTELYYQRVAALKVGKTYTSLAKSSFQTLWAKEISGKILQKPTHEQWIRLLEQEAKAIAKGQGNNRLGILVGDSLSMWFPSSGLPGGQLWLNQGISGENSSQILNRLEALSVTRPDTIYVMAGTNDLRQGVSDEVILDNIRQIVSQLRQNHPQAQIVVESILPTRLSAVTTDSEVVARFRASRISNLNQQIAAIAKQAGAGYLNLNALFADSQGLLRPDLTTDGIHLSRRGYEVWQDALHYTESVMSVNRVAKK